MAELIKKLFRSRDSAPGGLRYVSDEPEQAEYRQQYDGGMYHEPENAGEGFKYKGDDIPQSQVQDTQGSPEIQ